MEKQVLLLLPLNSFKGGRMYVNKQALQSNHTYTLHIIFTVVQCFPFITGGNVVRGNRTAMQMKFLRDHPDMSY